ncbi:MAG: ABC transporter ATP-binding protein [Chloroflexota bacterium]
MKKEESNHSSAAPLAVDMRDITIKFPGVLANDNVNFTLGKGEIHALLGENGAGKSTLMNALAGINRPNSGEIWIDGALQNFSSPKDAIKAGIGMVHQHFMLVPTQTVTENILLGLDNISFFMNMSRYEQEVRDLAEQFNLQIDPEAYIWQLSVGEQQRVEILKMLYRGANILIMDEPTAVLAPQEIEGLMSTLRAMTQRGKSIIFISHKLNEVESIADRVTVLRKGTVTAEGIDMLDMDRKKLAQLMVGRDVVFRISKETSQPGDVVLDVKNVSALNKRGVPSLKNISLSVRAGEILGIAGVSGNGQSELAEVITGLRQCEGSILVNGDEMANQPPIKAIEQGVAHIPEDRNKVGSSPNLSITENTILKDYRSDPIGEGWKINFLTAEERASGLKDKYDILAPNVATMARKLSGGNLQKVILAREITTKPRLMVAVQPTRGLDVGAIEAIQKLLLEQRSEGTAILLISEELEELLALSDRLAVIHDGQIMGVIDDVETADIEEIGLMMTGEKVTG